MGIASGYGTPDPDDLGNKSGRWVCRADRIVVGLPSYQHSDSISRRSMSANNPGIATHRNKTERKIELYHEPRKRTHHRVLLAESSHVTQVHYLVNTP